MTPVRERRKLEPDRRARSGLPPGGGRDVNLLRGALVVVWLGAALVGVLQWRDEANLLAVAHVVDPWAVRGLLGGAVFVNTMLGVLMWLWPGRRVYLAALGILAAGTLGATVVAPMLWLSALGPLLKNVVMAAVLVVLIRHEPRN
jgi:hypothetical protein